MRTINKIYIGVSILLLLVAGYLAYRFFVKTKKIQAGEDAEKFKILDEFLKENLAAIQADRKPDWRIKVKLSSCKHGVTFEQALARELNWIVEHNGGKVKIASGEYTIPLTTLLKWRDARDGRSPHYGKSTVDAGCTIAKITKIYNDEHVQIPYPLPFPIP